jgi:hypothetical protein
MMGKEDPNSFSSAVRAAIHAADLRIPHKEEKPFIDRVLSVVNKDPEVKDDQEKRLALRSKVTPAVLKNVVVLMWSFGFVAADIRPLLKAGRLNPEKVRQIIRVRRQEVAFLAGVYGRATSDFGTLETALASATSLGEIDLIKELANRLDRPSDDERAAPKPLRLVQFIEDIRGSEEFQEGAPDAVSRIVERYIDVGALKIAEGLLDQAFSQTTDHAGLWFQKARLLLAKSEREGREVSHYRMLEGESEVLSAAERHWGEMADDHISRMMELRLQVFDVCVEALRLLPERKGYDEAGRKWSTGWESTNDLRRQILIHVVREAGLRADPYRPFGGIQDRVFARLGRLRRFAPPRGFVVDPSECERLSAEPLFSADKDPVLMAAYDELMADTLTWQIRPGLRLLALNYIRLIAPERHAAEVALFVEDLKMMGGERACGIVGTFDPIPVDGEVQWRVVMNEHLDAVMSRAAQRELAIDLHRKWMAWVEQMKSETVADMYIDDARMHFQAGRWSEAYKIACEGEEKGFLTRSDDMAAFVLRQTALAAAKAAHEEGDDALVEEIVARHLRDREMADLAQSHLSRYEDEDCIPSETPFDGEDLDLFAKEIGVEDA